MSKTKKPQGYILSKSQRKRLKRQEQKAIASLPNAKIGKPA